MSPSKIANALFFLAFLLSAAVQYNDPDALIWIAMYLTAAGLCVVYQLGLNHRPFAGILLAISAVWAAFLLPKIVGQVSLSEIFESLTMKTKAVEEAREIGGLVFISAWSLVLLVLKGPGGAPAEEGEQQQS